MPDVVLCFSYRDKQGVGSLRRVRATSMAWCLDPRYQGKPCLRAFDLDRDDWRTFLYERMGPAVQVLPMQDARPAAATCGPASDPYEEAGEPPPF